MSAEVVHDEGARRWELLAEGRVVGLLEYERAGDVFDLFHTEVEPALRNRGLGAQLVQAALDDVRASGGRVVPTCPFVRAFVRRHEGYADLVD